MQSSRYVAPVAVFGAHVALDQLYNSVRFRLDLPYWLGHLTDGESSVVADDKSILRVEASPDGNWLVYESSAPATLRALEIRAVASCLALVQLALRPDEDLVTRGTQVRIDSDSAWLTVHGPGFCAEPGSAQLDTLLAPTELTVGRLAKWIELNDRFDGLAFAVARRMKAQVQLLTSLVEGFHRRLPESFEQVWFPRARKAALKRVRKAAAKAAADQAEKEGLDRELMSKLVTRSVGHVGDKSYRERAEAVVDKVGAAVPEIPQIVPNLPARLTDPRHSFAHQLPQDDEADPLDDRVRRWIVISRITPWLLRALLLLEIGVDAEVLRKKYLENEYFAFDRVNAELRVRELGWDLPLNESMEGGQVDPAQKGREADPTTIDDWVLTLTYNVDESEDVTDAWEDDLAEFDATASHIPGRGIDITVYAPGDLSMPEAIDKVSPQVTRTVGYEPVAMNIERESEYRRRAW